MGFDKPAVDDTTGIDYSRAMGFIKDSPNWAMNVLMGALCVFSTSVIPVVGQLLWIGYQYEIVESLHTKRQNSYPDFDLERFMDYLVRGFWVFLVSVVLSFIMVPIGLIVVGGMVAVGIATGGAVGGDEGAMIVVITIVALVAIGILLSCVLGSMMTPFVLRAGLSQSFAEAFNMSFAMDFIGKMWVELIKVTLFGVLLGIGAGFVGLLALCIGIYPAMAYVLMVQAHLMFQLYELYLARGGEEIPLKRPEPPVAGPVQA